MRRTLLFFFALVLCIPLVSCNRVADPTGENVEIEPDMLGPLFRIVAREGQTQPETVYYPTDSGVAYVSRTEKGYMGGYFVLPNLISNEEIFRCKSAPSPVFDLGKEKAAVFADDKLFLLSLEEGRANEFELFGKMRHTDILLGADGAFYYENEGYILTADLDFNEDYTSLSVSEKVVMETDKIRGYTGMLGVSEDGERFYYTYEENGETGYAFFGIGYQAETLGKTRISYRALTRVNGFPRALFESEMSDGKICYTLVDYAAGEYKQITVPAGSGFSSVAVNFTGTHLIGHLAKKDGLGGFLDLYSFESGKRLKHYELADLKINPSLALTKTAKYVVVGQFDDGTAYDDVGGETVTRIEVKY